MTTGAAARAVPEVAFLSSWVRISAKCRAHFSLLMYSKAYMHAVEYDYTDQKS